MKSEPSESRRCEAGTARRRPASRRAAMRRAVAAAEPRPVSDQTRAIARSPCQATAWECSP
jgi:hypothetical protein